MSAALRSILAKFDRPVNTDEVLDEVIPTGLFGNNRKTLRYRVNSIMSAKPYLDIFQKQSIMKGNYLTFKNYFYMFDFC